MYTLLSLQNFRLTLKIILYFMIMRIMNYLIVMSITIILN